MNYKIKIIDCDGSFILGYDNLEESLSFLKRCKVVGSGETLLMDKNDNVLYKKQFHTITKM